MIHQRNERYRLINHVQTVSNVIVIMNVREYEGRRDVDGVSICLVLK